MQYLFLSLQTSLPHELLCSSCIFMQFIFLSLLEVKHILNFITDARKGNVFKGVCQSFCSQGSLLWGGLCSGGISAPGQSLLGRGRSLLSGGVGTYPLLLTSNGGHCSGRYASYWNAFLYCRKIHHISRNGHRKDVYSEKNATQIRQRAHILKVKYCFNIHNAHLNLVLPILG